MMTTSDDVLIRGETVADLVAAIRGLALGEPDDLGMVGLSGEIGDAAIRALMRIEAELLLEDANALDRSPLERTEDQRRHDAFGQLGRELCSALGLSVDRAHAPAHHDPDCRHG